MTKFVVKSHLSETEIITDSECCSLAPVELFFKAAGALLLFFYARARVEGFYLLVCLLIRTSLASTVYSAKLKLGIGERRLVNRVLGQIVRHGRLCACHFTI